MKVLSVTFSSLLILAPVAVACAEEDKTQLAQQAQTILKTSCYRCHGEEGSSEGGFNFVIDQQRLVAGRKIVPGNSAQSQLYKKLSKGYMPPEDEKPRPTPAEVDVIRQWIEVGAPSWNRARCAFKRRPSTFALITHQLPCAPR